MTCSQLHRTSFGGLALLCYHLFEQVITFKLVYKSFLVTCHVSVIQAFYHGTLFYSLFGLLYWTSQCKLSVTLIINFNFLMYFIRCHCHYQILDFKIFFSLKMHLGKRTNYQFFNDFISVILISNTSYIITRNKVKSK